MGGSPTRAIGLRPGGSTEANSSLLSVGGLGGKAPHLNAAGTGVLVSYILTTTIENLYVLVIENDLAFSTLSSSYNVEFFRALVSRNSIIEFDVLSFDVVFCHFRRSYNSTFRYPTENFWRKFALRHNLSFTNALAGFGDVLFLNQSEGLKFGLA